MYRDSLGDITNSVPSCVHTVAVQNGSDFVCFTCLHAAGDVLAGHQPAFTPRRLDDRGRNAQGEYDLRRLSDGESWKLQSR
jgi:hypothetical protein